VEKPLALERAGAEEAARACRSRGLVLAVGFDRRFRPAVQEMQRLAREGALGTLLHLEGAFSGPTLARPGQTGPWRSARTENPGGAMTGRGIHVADLMISIAGPIASVFGYSERRVLEVDMDDTTSLMLRFRGGQTGTLSTLRATADFWRLHVFGSKGWAEVRGERHLITCEVGGSPQVRDYGETDTLHAALESFADAIAGRGSYPVAPEEAVNSATLLEALLRSVATSGPVTLG
jgi:predicted dehydrogenase